MKHTRIETYLDLHTSMLNQCPRISNKATHGAANILISSHNFLNTARFLNKAKFCDIKFDKIGSGAKPEKSERNREKVLQ
jgi:hypothetical protein